MSKNIKRISVQTSDCRLYLYGGGIPYLRGLSYSIVFQFTVSFTCKVWLSGCSCKCKCTNRTNPSFWGQALPCVAKLSDLVLQKKRAKHVRYTSTLGYLFARKAIGILALIGVVTLLDRVNLSSCKRGLN